MWLNFSLGKVFLIMFLLWAYDSYNEVTKMIEWLLRKKTQIIDIQFGFMFRWSTMEVNGRWWSGIGWPERLPLNFHWFGEGVW